VFVAPLAASSRRAPRAALDRPVVVPSSRCRRAAALVEFRAALGNYGLRELSVGALHTLFKNFDRDDSGSISYEEFYHAVVETKDPGVDERAARWARVEKPKNPLQARRSRGDRSFGFPRPRVLVMGGVGCVRACRGTPPDLRAAGFESRRRPRDELMRRRRR
jgi:hypothetical protein